MPGIFYFVYFLLLSYTYINGNLYAYANANTNAGKEYYSIGDKLLIKGNYKEALENYNNAIELAPKNCMYLYKRSIAYQSLGKNQLALNDLNKAISIRKDFKIGKEERSKIYKKEGKWELAKADLNDILKYNDKNDKNDKNNKKKLNDQIKDLNHFKNLENLSNKEFKKKNYKLCVEHANDLIAAAPLSLSIRLLRANCNLHMNNNDNKIQAINDFYMATNLLPYNEDLIIKTANLQFFIQNNYKNSLTTIKKCFKNDPDSKKCLKKFRKIKEFNKILIQIEKLLKSGSYIQLEKLLTNQNDDNKGTLIDQVQTYINSLLTEYNIPNIKSDLILYLKEKLCDTFYHNKKPDIGLKYCIETFDENNESIIGIIGVAEHYIVNEKYEDAIRFLENKKNLNPKLEEKYNEAQVLLKRSKEKDYYKILNVKKDATEREIKKAHRNLVRQFHPDKYKGDLSKEKVLNKITEINEAYEVLSNKESRDKYDAGIDPNQPAHNQQYQHQQQNNHFHFNNFHHQKQHAFHGQGGNFMFNGFPF